MKTLQARCRGARDPPLPWSAAAAVPPPRRMRIAADAQAASPIAASPTADHQPATAGIAADARRLATPSKPAAAAGTANAEAVIAYAAAASPAATAAVARTLLADCDDDDRASLLPPAGLTTTPPWPRRTAIGVDWLRTMGRARGAAPGAHTELERAACRRCWSSSARQALQRSCRPSFFALQAWYSACGLTCENKGGQVVSRCELPACNSTAQGHPGRCRKLQARAVTDHRWARLGTPAICAGIRHAAAPTLLTHYYGGCRCGREAVTAVATANITRRSF